MVIAHIQAATSYTASHRFCDTQLRFNSSCRKHNNTDVRVCMLSIPVLCGRRCRSSSDLMPRSPLHRLSQHLSPVRRLATHIQLSPAGRHAWKTLAASHWQQLAARRTTGWQANIERRLADLERQHGTKPAMGVKSEPFDDEMGLWEGTCKRYLAHHDETKAIIKKVEEHLRRSERFKQDIALMCRALTVFGESIERREQRVMAATKRLGKAASCEVQSSLNQQVAHGDATAKPLKARLRPNVVGNTDHTAKRELADLFESRFLQVPLWFCCIPLGLIFWRLLSW